MAASRLLTTPLAILLAGVAGCLEPTEAIVEISTDASCEDVSGTGITGGLLFDIETLPFGTTTDACSSGDIGSIVLVPGEDDEDDAAFAFKVVTSLDVPVDSCIAPAYGPGCIVARRALRYVPHEPFRLPVQMAAACAGVICPPEQTCVDGTCQSATCEAPGSCEPVAQNPGGFVKQFGGAGNEMARAVAFGSSTLVVAGNFDGALDLGGPLGSHESHGSQDAFVSAFTPDGVHRWSRAFGGAGLDEALSVAIAPSADIYVLAIFSDTIDLGGGPLTSAGATDLVVAKYKSFGKLVWAVRLGGPGGETPGSLAVAPDNGVYVVGSFAQEAAIGELQIQSAGGSDAFVAQLGDSGAVRWAQSLGGAGEDGLTSVAVDATGRVFVGGYFEGEAEIASELLAAVGTADAVIASFEADGAPRWAKSFGANGRDLVMGLAAGDQRVVATGVLANAASYDGTLIEARNQDGFVMSLDGDGNLGWAQVFGDDGSDQGESVSLAADGSVVVTGQIFHGSAFGSEEVSLGGMRNPFLAVLEPDGKPRWAQAQGSGMYAGAPAVAAAPNGFAYVVGWFVDEMAVGDEHLTSNGNEDAFVVRVGPP
jgi:outer membrane protein assembly factor BamB